MKAKKFLAGALVGALLVFIALSAFAAGLTGVQAPPEDVLARANEFARRVGMLDYDFFVDQNEKGDNLRFGGITLPHEGMVDYLVWGPWHSDPNWDGEGTVMTDRNGFPRARYLGYGRYGERVSNVFFPPDKPGDWKPLSDADFIEKPWYDPAVRQAFPQFFAGPVYTFNDKDNPDLFTSMQTGLSYCALGNEFGPPDIESDLYKNPQKYVHVFLPPSEKTWGAGVMFNRNSDGNLYYMSVPLPDLLTPEVRIVDAISLTPPERAGKPGEKVSFDLKVSWEGFDAFKKVASDLGFDLGLYVRVSHQVNGTPYAVPFALDGANSQDAGDGWARVDIPDPDDRTEKTGSVAVTIQNVPSEVVAQVYPYLKDRKYGLLFLLDKTFLDKTARAKVMPNLPNLVAVSINPGVSGEAEPDTRYTGTVVFKNDSDQPLENVPVGVFHREYRAVLKDASGNEVQYTSFGPREEKTFWFNWTAPTAGTTRLTAVIDTPPLENKYQEITEDDNKKQVDIGIRDVDNSSPGDRRLNLQAYSKPGEDIYGEWHDARAREPFTAKWTDDVHTTLTVDRPTPPRGTLDWWEISWAKITYPRVADDFSFGNPVPPDGTVTKWMDVPGRGLEAQKQAKIVFEEDWALDGFPIHNMMTGEDMAVNPKHYPVSVQFEVTYQYSYIVCVCGKDGCTCWVETRTASYTDTASANLLVNGAGTIPYAS